jgi:hypothetical protein
VIRKGGNITQGFADFGQSPKAMMRLCIGMQKRCASSRWTGRPRTSNRFNTVASGKKCHMSSDTPHPETAVHNFLQLIDFIFLIGQNKTTLQKYS